ncbi:MAG: hypothetical protein E6I76_00200 [Chloroflexi bacterium]|nr:MAG: hypothetical protein E6I76_00200 [Chloroflexota bacterium]
MLIQDFVYIDAPVGVVGRRLAAGAEGWLTPLAARASRQDGTLEVRIGPAGDVPMLSRTTKVAVGSPVERGDTIVIPMVWQADGMSAAFPVLWADLEVAPLADGETQLTLLGRYDPPLGALGRQLDRLLLHRIAQASVRCFLEGVAAALETAARIETG